MRYTIKTFNEKFPDDDTCLNYLFEQAYGDMQACPKCGIVEPSYYRVKNRKCFECKDCGNQIHPLANTIFHKSSTPLRSWFYIIYLFSVAKNGVSAKEVERHLGVTYKCAWRIAKQVRELMNQETGRLTGIVETDETYIGGRKRGKDITFQDKEIVFGMVERGGKVKASHVRSAGARVLLPRLQESIANGATIYSDQARVYSTLKRLGYLHDSVNHSIGEYGRGVVHTNTIEGFWGQLKRSIDGTYHCVSPKYLQSYVNEFVYRYNYRTQPVFPILIASAARRVQ
ncbi:MAG TPA: IS1595 family transposase [Candidatus Saccharimonadales bacterium]